jgi:hypothetical protein
MTDAKRAKIEREYTAEHAKAIALLERIGNLLQDLPAPGNADQPIHYGHIGDLARVNYLLKEIETFLDRSQRGE